MISIKSMVDKKLKKIDKAIEAIQRASPPLAVAAPHNQMQVQPPQVGKHAVVTGGDNLV